MLWGGRWEGGSCLGTHVRIKDFKIKKRKKQKKNKHRTLHLKPYVIEKNLHSVLVLCGITLFQGLISSFNLTETDFNTEFTNE